MARQHVLKHQTTPTRPRPWPVPVQGAGTEIEDLDGAMLGNMYHLSRGILD